MTTLLSKMEQPAGLSTPAIRPARPPSPLLKKGADFFFPFLTALFLLASYSLAVAGPNVAVFLPETGRLSQLAFEMKRAVMIAEYAWSEHDPKGLHFVFIDNYCDADSAEAVAERLASREDVIAFAGGLPSECAQVLTAIAAEHALPYLIFSASEDILTRCGNKFVFRVAPPSSDYDDGLLGWAGTIVGSGRRIAVVHENHPRSSEAVADLKSDLASLWRGEVFFKDFEPGENDFSPLIQTVAAQKPTLVWIISSTTDAARFLRQCRADDWMPNAFALGMINLVNNRIISLAEDAADYCYAPAVWWPLPNTSGAEDFIRQFTELVGHAPEYHSAEAYAGAQALLDAAARCLDLNRENLRLALEDTDLPTVIGGIRFEQYRGFTNQNRQRTLAVQLRGDRWFVVWPRVRAERNYVYPPPTWKERARLAQKPPSKTQNLLFIPFMLLIGMMLWAGARRRKEMLRKMDEDQ